MVRKSERKEDCDGQDELTTLREIRHDESAARVEYSVEYVKQHSEWSSEHRDNAVLVYVCVVIGIGKKRGSRATCDRPSGQSQRNIAGDDKFAEEASVC
jgi:hypothetical protein